MKMNFSQKDSEERRKGQSMCYKRSLVSDCLKVGLTL
jgi:hypothetical protein